MHKRSIDPTILLLGLVGLTPCTAGAQTGTAVVRVVTEPPGAAAFEFAGVPAGTVTAGSSLEATALAAGSYTSTQVETGAPWVLAGIDCDDQRSGTPSVGTVASRSVAFNVDARETVICTFTYASRPAQQSGSSSTGGAAPSGGGTNPFTTPDEDFDKFPLPGDLPTAAGTFAVPKAGPWDVENHRGQMVCAGINVPLSPDRGRGTLEVRDGGATVIGAGLAEDTAPITMRAVPAITGRYAGSVGGEQDGIPMTIEFFWQLVTDESIIGYLTSSVSARGMSCNMSRTFALEYAGG